MKSKNVFVQMPSFYQSKFENNEEQEKDLLLELKTKQLEAKKDFNSNFLTNLKELLDKCFMPLKQKKNDFITKEKLILEFLQLLQSQKKFKDTDFIKTNLCCLSIFDNSESYTGKLVNVNFFDKYVEYYPIYLISPFQKKISVKKTFKEVDFFDPFSLQFEKYYRKQRIVHDPYSYEDTFKFLTSKFEIKKEVKDYAHYSLGRGIPLSEGVRERCEVRDLPD